MKYSIIKEVINLVTRDDLGTLEYRELPTLPDRLYAPDEFEYLDSGGNCTSYKSGNIVLCVCESPQIWKEFICEHQTLPNLPKMWRFQTDTHILYLSIYYESVGNVTTINDFEDIDWYNINDINLRLSFISLYRLGGYYRDIPRPKCDITVIDRTIDLCAVLADYAPIFSTLYYGLQWCACMSDSTYLCYDGVPCNLVYDESGDTVLLYDMVYD